jgi:transglutaminase-like putative cysteine protease
VSTHAQVAVLEPGAIQRVGGRAEREQLYRPGVRWAAFSALALYGTLRWGALLAPAPNGRLLVLVALAATVAGPLRWLALRARLPAAVLAAVSVVAMLAACGIPAGWLEHVRLAVAGRAIGGGITTLPHVLVPYNGLNEWVRVVIVLGAGVLLLDAALLFCFSPRRISEAWAAGVALPLVVLAVLPSTLSRPQVPYLHGLFLFVLLAVFMWADRVRSRAVPAAVAVAGLAVVAAMVISPALDPHKPWLNYESLAGNLAAGNLDHFDWTQHYGPLNWPRSGREVLDVQATRADYWKAEDLNVFDGQRWVEGATPSADQLPQPDPAALARWSQTIHVRLRNMQSFNVIAAGVSDVPQQLQQPVEPGSDAGTWTAQAPLQPGDSYSIRTYSPRPSAAQLSQAGTDYPFALQASYGSMLLPATGTVPGPAIIFPAFHSRAAAQRLIGISGTDGSGLIDGSPYRRAYALARRLAAGSRTPYAFVQSVLGLLRHGYRYDEHPPLTRYPLETFLFDTRRGYCQQFSGATALLLRMGGLPARVAAGFTPGSYNLTEHQWIVSDLNAHAWVEVWFPHFGWVRFDPTPLSAPARSPTTGIAPNLRAKTSGGTQVSAPRPRELGTASQPAGKLHPSGGGSLGWLGVLTVAALAVAGGAFVLRRRQPTGRDDDGRIAELERALERCGRPASGGLTLARLERRLGTASPAGEYVRALRLARFGGAEVTPTAAQRRALRLYLREGLGPFGGLRAWWALPPVRRGSRPRPNRPDGA